MLSLSLRLRPHTFPLLSPLPITSQPAKRASLTFRNPYSFSSPRMSSSSAFPQQVIEHIVLFKVREGTEQSKVNAMMSGLNGLNSLDQVLYLTAGPVLRSASSLFSFTHMLHSRYSTKDDLSAYSAHPEHLRVVRETGLPICEDIMAVDWIADGFSGPLAPPPESALKVSFLKLKEDLGDAVKDEVLGVIRGIKDGPAAVEQLTCGENFSPARAKGFSVASLAVFKGVAEMEAAESNKELVESHKEKVREYLDGVIVIDFVVPGSSSNL
ncbi:hypothetical protein CDL15_Pgr028927 [Punica granatum]|uniref:Stress-response A/B barrel domain-containing protein n=3 Tax=Punica granatum TaxID=22663 RepID=A0A218WY35_PUNGR|nr:hypothetical protein CDL15_Pgr028927 [Punica granatum]